MERKQMIKIDGTWWSALSITVMRTSDVWACRNAIAMEVKMQEVEESEFSVAMDNCTLPDQINRIIQKIGNKQREQGNHK